jgi:hypothetical protein
MNCFKCLAGLLVIAALLSSGCAAIVKGSTQDLTINTDPTGANCDLSRSGIVIATVNPTPGLVQIKKDKNDIEVKCKKSGYAETSGNIPSNFEGWTVGNILIGGFIGIAIDYSSGALNKYEPELLVKLTPEKFASSEDKADFYDKWRSDVLQNSTKAKIAASKTCVKEQCDEISRRIDRETEQALAGIEANRNMRSKTAAAADSPVRTEASPAGATRASASAIQSAAPAGDVRPAWMPRVGDQWKYQVSYGRQSVGNTNVEIIEAHDNTVRERITFDRSRGFVTERDVEVGFKPARFQPLAMIPGGYQMAEVSPYAAPDTQFNQNQKWNDIAGEFAVQGSGRKSALSQGRVIAREKVRVPAGEFNAWKFESESERIDYNGVSFTIKCRYWYAPEIKRTVKMHIVTDSPLASLVNTETYELVSYETGK